MPKEVTREARKNIQYSPYPVPRSAAEPRKLEECIKIRTGELLRHRELCGNTIISRGRSKRSFRAEYRKCHAMKPTIWNYSRSKTKATVSLEHAIARVQQAHGLVDRDILLTGGEKNIIQIFLVGENEHGTAPLNYEADCILPQNVPRNKELAQRLGSSASAGAIFWSTSDVSCVNLFTSAREVADSVSNHLVESKAPVILAKACEMFIQELTLWSWDHTEEKKRRTLQRGDIAIAVTDVFDFLVDTFPRESSIEEEVRMGQTPIPIVPAPHGHHHRHPLPNPPHQTRLDHKLQQFWAKQSEEAFHTTDFKAHGLPLARIKKIVKSEDKVQMVGSEVPLILAKACEMFIQELTLRSWDHTEEKKRRTLQRGDIAIAVEKIDVFDFLVDIVPRERSIEEVVGIRQRGGGGGFGQCPCEGASYSYMPPPPAPPTFVGNPAGQSFTSQPMWPIRPPPLSFVVNAHDAAQFYVAQPMWPRPPLRPPPSSVVNVGDAAQSHGWPQPPPPVPSAGLSDVAAMQE